MDIREIKIKNEGYILCNSSFYSVNDILTNREFNFVKGVNLLEGEIDSGIFGVSYLISMYDRINKKTIFAPFEATVNGETMHLSELSEYSCYLDQSHSLFSSKKTVRALVEQGLKKSKMVYSADEICNMFHISEIRFNRPINATGNEKFKVMSAIGFSNGKQIFCFPWLSKMRYESINNHMTNLLDTLASLGKIVILPIGKLPM